MPAHARAIPAERRAQPRPAPAPVVALPRIARPAPEVVRRRRILAVSGILAFAVLVTLAVGVVGRHADAGRIERLLSTGASRPATLCDHMSAAMAATTGGRAGCLRSSPAHGPGGRVHDVRVSGAKATAQVTTAGRVERFRLVREDGDWKVDDVR